MKIFPAIDLFDGKAVRLLRGRYEDMTIYSDDPPQIGRDFAAAGAEYIHIVDLEGAKDGTTPNFDTVCRIKETSGCFCEIGGGIRSMEVVGIDLKDGYVAIKGWTEKTQLTAVDFCEQMQALGVTTIIVTDISKDGAMKGTNHGLYEELSARLGMQLVASGGVSSIDDVKRLAARGLYGAIIGKAYYTGAIDLKEAIAAADAAR